MDMSLLRNPPVYPRSAGVGTDGVAFGAGLLVSLDQQRPVCCTTLCVSKERDLRLSRKGRGRTEVLIMDASSSGERPSERPSNMASLRQGPGRRCQIEYETVARGSHLRCSDHRDAEEEAVARVSRLSSGATGAEVG